MKNINLKHFIWISLSLLAIWSCAEEDGREPFSKNLTPPGQISEYSVENLPGRAKITYSLPSDKDLLYIKAQYTLGNGRKMEVKSSYFNNSLVVEGFADTLSHEIKLYSVNRSEVASEPVSVMIKPLEAPLWEVYRSLEVNTAFGGIRINALNPFREDIAILVMEKNEYGDWEIDPNSVYTSTDSIDYAIRGMDTTMHEFAFTIRDRWLNYTDTVFQDISPLFEMPLPKANYRGFPLPGDAPGHPSTSHAGMWDGNIIDWPSIYMTQAVHQGPHTITFDVGVLAKMSRIVIWDYPEYFNGRTYYYLHCLKEFEIYGTDNPNPNGSMDGWELLGRYNATKPSGLPHGQQTDEDFRVANEGFSWEFDINAPKVRYLRIRSTRNWGGSTNMAISEIQVYGDPR
ncbi:DUF4959 domain-containing protein [Belliella kenyensis]|uniref:DUF4959 domain-containing protein n=1 Tax=Belliella kenyensis TaxID=1472724 RepID=A0ABV8EI20_9BACT|nr:DUF4959 domain-containing protein [Belliella kenyensis]MCH7400986.1 DUF4959 domain-containing protein [Belliella kenyensis]MDN3603984.1 DUF4959 domain-containing protein [Belliella kenyensis]